MSSVDSSWSFGDIGMATPDAGEVSGSSTAIAGSSTSGSAGGESQSSVTRRSAMVEDADEGAE